MNCANGAGSGSLAPVWPTRCELPSQPLTVPWGREADATWGSVQNTCGAARTREERCPRETGSRAVALGRLVMRARCAAGGRGVACVFVPSVRGRSAPLLLFPVAGARVAAGCLPRAASTARRPVPLACCARRPVVSGPLRRGVWLLLAMLLLLLRRRRPLRRLRRPVAAGRAVRGARGPRRAIAGRLSRCELRLQSGDLRLCGFALPALVVEGSLRAMRLGSKSLARGASGLQTEAKNTSVSAQPQPASP